MTMNCFSRGARRPNRTSFFRQLTLLAALISGGLGAGVSRADSSTMDVFYSLSTSATSSTLLKASDGNFYGTTWAGGDFFLGSVFRLTPAGEYTTIYSFTGGSQGCNPNTDSSLVQAANGNFYGTTNNSGQAADSGVAFRLGTDGSYTVLHAFDNSTEGSSDLGPLVAGKDGNLYGANNKGGQFNVGTLYKMTPAGAVTVLHHFGSSATDGALPSGSLILASDGNFYGTTLLAQSSIDYGTVFKLTAGGRYSVLVSNPSIGCYPEQIVDGKNGALYGVSACGGGPYSQGTVFRVTTKGRITVLHQMLEGFDPVSPETLVLGDDGNLYGASPYLGTGNIGAIFRVSPSGQYSTIYNFEPGEALDGNGVIQAALTPDGSGHLYGSTEHGGSADEGSFFRLTSATNPPTASLTVSAHTVRPGAMLNITWGYANTANCALTTPMGSTPLTATSGTTSEAAPSPSMATAYVYEITCSNPDHSSTSAFGAVTVKVPK
jgi:uncharacterized repeat protein (TIGR03803 family)